MEALLKVWEKPATQRPANEGFIAIPEQKYQHRPMGAPTSKD